MAAVASAKTGHSRNESLTSNGNSDGAFRSATTTTSEEELRKLSRYVQVVKTYLEQANDVNIAVDCLEPLVKAINSFDSGSVDVRRKHLLETIATALDVLCNHCRYPDATIRKSLLEYVSKEEKIDLARENASLPDFAFLFARVRSAVTFSLDYSRHGDTFGGLVFDTASILLSHAKYDVSPQSHSPELVVNY
jgi:hypothetical protein